MKSRILKLILFCLRIMLSCLPVRLRLLLKTANRIVVPVDYRKARISILAESNYEYFIRSKSCRREPFTVEWLDNLPAGAVLCDIGANVGTYSLIAAKRGVPVYAFEPSFLNYSQLCRNIALNHCSDTIQAFPIALAQDTQIGILNYSEMVTGASEHAFGRPLDFTGKPFRPVLQQTMIGYCLDDFLEQFKMRKPTHIKMDVDGLEYEVLLGAEKTLRQAQGIIIEVSEGYDNERVEAMLVLCGFKRTGRYKLTEATEGRYSRMYMYRFEREQRAVATA